MRIFFYDLETTSDDPETARIVQFAYRIVNSETWETEKQNKQLVNPGRPIDPGATEVHGISNEMVQGKPSFSAFASGALDVINSCDAVGGYNSRQFDDVILEKEMSRLGISFSLLDRPCVDVYAMINKLFPRSLTGMVKMFLGEDMENAHDADADVSYTVRLAQKLIIQEGVDMQSINDLLFSECVDRQGKLKFNDDGQPCFTFGKLKDKTLQYGLDNEYEYLDWMLRADFPEDFKAILRDAQRGVIPTKT